jgi:phosphoribosylamine-glycine ligase
VNVLIHSKSGDALSLGLRMQAEGHAVWLATTTPDAARVGDGLIVKVSDPVAVAREKADLVIFDMVGHGGLADSLRDDGVSVLGAGVFEDEIELRRLYAMETFRAAGLRIPPTEFFPDADLERAIRFVEKHAGRWVFKPSGNLGTDKTFLAEDAEDMVDYLEHLGSGAASEDAKLPPFLLQRFVKGAEISTERWYAQGRPIPALDNCTLEEKKFLAGNLGPAVGCAGNVVLPGADLRLVRETVVRLDRLAAEHEVCGPIDLNAIVAEDDHKPYILEATARFGYDALQAFVALWRMPIAETLQALAEGEEPQVILAPGVSAAVRVSIPPYPHGDATKARGAPIVDDVLDDRDVWVGDVMLDDEERVVCSGADAVVYIRTARAPTIRDAYEKIYRVLKESRLPDRQYRPDLMERAVDRYSQLRAWGYFTGARRVAA